MKALALWQPWASLVAVGAKRIETRSWAAPPELIGRRVAVYATKTKQHIYLAQQPPFNRYLGAQYVLPLGVLVAVVELAECVFIDSAEMAYNLQIQQPDEYAFGDYAPGRYAWRLRAVRRLEPPEPHQWTGRRRLTDVTRPL